jgi:hypothetical protein
MKVWKRSSKWQTSSLKKVGKECEKEKIEHFIVHFSRGTHIESNGPINHYNELAIIFDEKYWIMKLV